jgi:hypothetical protein
MSISLKRTNLSIYHSTVLFYQYINQPITAFSRAPSRRQLHRVRQQADREVLKEVRKDTKTGGDRERTPGRIRGRDDLCNCLPRLWWWWCGLVDYGDLRKKRRKTEAQESGATNLFALVTNVWKKSRGFSEVWEKTESTFAERERCGRKKKKKRGLIMLITRLLCIWR